MSEWKNYRLGEIADITSSKRIFYSEYVSNGVPFYRSKEIIDKSGKREVQTELFISEARFDEINKKFGVPKTNDILLTSVGTLGIPYLVGTGDRFYFKDGNLTWFRNIDNAKVDPKFLFIWLQSKIGKQKLDEVTIGSTQPALTISGLKTIKICLPEVNEQRAIAEVLSSLDDKIDLLHRQNKTLESLAQTLFRHWFIEQAKDEWEEGTLADFAYNIRDSIKPSKIAPDTKYVGLEHIERKHLALHAFGTGSDVESNKSVFRKHDILFGKLRPYFHKVCFAPFDGICSTDILVIRPKARNFFAFSLMAFFQKEVVDHSDMASEGTRMPRTNWKILSSYPLPIPDDETMARFNETIQPIIEKIEANISQIASLARTRDDLLPKMMTGEARTTYA